MALLSRLLPIVAGGKRMRKNFTPPPNANVLRPIELWSENRTPRRMHRDRGGQVSLPTALVRGLMPWEGDLAGLTQALVRCRECPQLIRREFRARDSWEEYLSALDDVLVLIIEEPGPMCGSAAFVSQNIA